jgi:two-component system chemotaxis response regulator CheY
MGYVILIVDDSETMRLMLERTLHMTRLPMDEIIKAENGRNALAVLKERWVDLVMTDLNMPEMTGDELIDNIKNDSALKNLPIVVISTEGNETVIQELHDKGIQGYLRKPFTPEHVRDLIINTIGEWK